LIRTGHANLGVCRFHSRLSRAVENATEVEKASSSVLEIKDKGGVIKNEFRETIADLTGVCGVPAKSSFQIFKKCVSSAGMEVNGSWDRQTVPQVMHEVTHSAEVLAVEQFLGSIGLLH
jgi:hypothetical protein